MTIAPTVQRVSRPEPLSEESQHPSGCRHGIRHSSRRTSTLRMSGGADLSSCSATLRTKSKRGTNE